MSRRRYAPSAILNVGAGILDGPGRNAPWTRQGCRVLRNGSAFAPMRRSRNLVRRGGTRRCRPTNMDGLPCFVYGAGTSSNMVRHKAAVHHPLTGWGRRPSASPGGAPSADGALDAQGVSPAAAGDQRLCLWKPRFFEKNRVKLLSFFPVPLFPFTSNQYPYQQRLSAATPYRTESKSARRKQR